MKCPNCNFTVEKCWLCMTEFRKNQTVECYLTTNLMREHKHENHDDCSTGRAIFTFKEE